MGKLTEYMAYLKCKPNKLVELKEKLSFITPNEEMKVVRNQLKLYKDE